MAKVTIAELEQQLVRERQSVGEWKAHSAMIEADSRKATADLNEARRKISDLESDLPEAKDAVDAAERRTRDVYDLIEKVVDRTTTAIEAVANR